MILDILENSGLYESIHPRFKQAFDFLRCTDLVELPLGRVELDGKNLFVNVVEITEEQQMRFVRKLTNVISTYKCRLLPMKLWVGCLQQSLSNLLMLTM